jgi:hypothetical protein
LAQGKWPWALYAYGFIHFLKAIVVQCSFVSYILHVILQQWAVPKARIEKDLFWDVLEEFPISQWVLH